MTILLHNWYQERTAEILAGSLDRLLTPGGVREVVARSAAESQQFKRSTIDPLLEIKRVTFQGFITVEYFSFPQWLAVNNPPWIRALGNGDPPISVVQKDIEKWRAERDAYLGTKDPSVLFQLDTISRSYTGAAILRALKDGTLPRRGAPGGRAISIFPDTDPTVPGNVTTTSDMKGATNHSTGADADIDYSPELWGQSTNRWGINGPGTAPDDILFHELVHATRDLKGVASKEKLHANRLFPSVEEYIAVVLTNIYISETKPLARLRGGYGDAHTFPTLAHPERFLDNLDHLVPSPRQLLQTFSTDQRALYDDLAFCDVILFNPIAQLEKEKNPDNFRVGTGFNFLKSMIAP
jgi:hypothetical protein